MLPEFFTTERFGLLVVGFLLASAASLLMSNAERRPPEFRLRINNAMLAGLSAAAVCAILVEQAVFSEDLIPAFCALLGLMADARTWRMVGGEWLSRYAERHGFSMPDKIKKELERQKQKKQGEDAGAKRKDHEANH